MHFAKTLNISDITRHGHVHAPSQRGAMGMTDPDASELESLVADAQKVEPLGDRAKLVGLRAHPRLVGVVRRPLERVGLGLARVYSFVFLTPVT